MKKLTRLQCFFGILSGGRYGGRCQNEATTVSTFNGADDMGQSGPVVWCPHHGPSIREVCTPGHGYRKITASDRETWLNTKALPVGGAQTTHDHD